MISAEVICDSISPQEKRLKPPPCTQSELKQIFDYDKKSGFLITKIARRGCPKGKRAGEGKPGRRAIMILGKEYYTARLIYFWVTGEWPHIVDHKDRNVRNECWSNLRAATYSQNGSNCTARNKTTGIKGVYKNSSKINPWFAQIGQTYLGSFRTIEAAAKAYNRAAKQRYGKFARGNS